MDLWNRVYCISGKGTYQHIFITQLICTHKGGYTEGFPTSEVDAWGYICKGESEKVPIQVSIFNKSIKTAPSMKVQMKIPIYHSNGCCTNCVKFSQLLVV